MTALFSGILGFGILTNAFSVIPFVLVILPLTYLFTLRLYTLNRKEDCIILQNALNSWTNTLQDGKGCGYSIGWSHYCYLSIDPKEFSNTSTAWILCTEKKFKQLFCEDSIVLKKESTEIPNMYYDVLHKSSGNFNNTYYFKAKGELDFQERLDQKKIINRICDLFFEKGRVTAYISGATNTGKSMIGVFIAQKLGGVYCNEFTPWIPGDSLNLLKQEHNPIRECPLVISMDEIDDAIIKIANGRIKSNETTMINTCTKNGWNTLFDNIERGMYPNTIILLTSNQSYEEIAKQCGGDLSYLREKRITEKFIL
jgi:hypothetical protein